MFMAVKVKRKILVSSLLAVSIIALGYLAYAALWGGDYLVFKVNSSTYVVDKVRAAEKQGGTLELGEADINGLLELYTKKGLGTDGVSIKGAYTHIAGGQMALYLPVTFHGLDFLLYAQGTVVYENEYITFVPAAFKVGKLELPKNYVMQELGRYLKGNITATPQGIAVSKKALPYDVTSLAVNGDKLAATIKKTSSQAGPAAAPTAPSTTPKQGSGNSASARESLLKRTSSQLTAVYADVESSEGKEIIAKIQAVVNKMIQNPAYQYQPEADAVKSQYGKLQPEQKNDIKDAILMNMEIDTLRETKAVFGL